MQRILSGLVMKILSSRHFFKSVIVTWDGSILMTLTPASAFLTMTGSVI
jgi:hypothetical protein